MNKKTIIKIIRFLAVFFGSLVALALLGLLFWEKVRLWFETPGFLGCDTPLFIHFVYYYMKNPGFPVNAWDYLFHSGTARVLDGGFWLHLYLIRPLVNFLGYYKAIKIYPIASLALLVVFCYLLFFQLSGSILLSLGLAASVVASKGLYIPLLDSGVVLSFISQVFLPAQLYFSVRYVQKRKKRDLIFTGLMAALGFYTHGLMTGFFSFLPTFIFLLLATDKLRQLVTKKSIKQAFLFALTALSVGALAFWPFILMGLQGGVTRYPWLTGIDKRPDSFKGIWEFSDNGVVWASIFGCLISLVFWVLNKKKPQKVLKPLLILELLFLFWFFTYTYTGNRLQGVFFPARIFWIYPIITGALAACLLAPLSDISSSKTWHSIIKFFSFGLIKLALALLISISVVPLFADYRILLSRLTEFQWPEFDLLARPKKDLAPLLELVDPEDINWKVFVHDGTVTMLWIRVADLPHVGGYFNIWTRWTRIWEGWFYGVVAKPNWDSQEIPRDMAEKQALFFIDWYGVRYLAGWSKGDEEWQKEFRLADRFYQDKDYVLRKTSNDSLDAFEIAPEYTSGVVEPVKSPAIGFVGPEKSYITFIQDLAMLNLNTSQLIPIRLADSIEGIKSKQLDLIDGLVIYDFRKKNSLLYNQGWNKIAQFVNRGGRVWIESGGNSTERENKLLPEAFPIKSSKYGDLGREWQPKGPIVRQFDFSTLEKLEYRGDPWHLSYTTEEAVKEGATVLLKQNDKPVAVEKKSHQGLVLWTGLNLFYRPMEYSENGITEAGLIKIFLGRLLEGLPKGKVETGFKREKPELYTVEGQGFSGIVFKQNNLPGWKAKAFYADKKKSLSILPAGPELMYIALPKEAIDQPVKVKIYYQGDPFHWLCFFITVIACLVVLDQIFGGHLLKLLRLKRFRYKPAKSRFTKIKTWWERE